MLIYNFKHHSFVGKSQRCKVFLIPIYNFKAQEDQRFSASDDYEFFCKLRKLC